MTNIICKKTDFIKIISNKKFKKVLELGPGDKGYSISTDYIDYFDNSISYPGKKFHVLDLNKSNRLPFNDNEFDFVIISHVLEHLKDPFIVMDEVSRVGKSGYIELPTRFEDNILSNYSTRNKDGEYPSDPYGHKWWFEYGLGGRLVVSERLPVLARSFSLKERNYLMQFMESNFILCVLWNDKIDWQKSKFDHKKIKLKKPFVLNEGSLFFF